VGLYYFEIPASPSSGNWPRVQITSEAREEGLALGDIDRDGDLDVAALVAPAGTTVAWWENPGDGSGSWPRSTVVSNQGSLNSMDVADLNGDGALDIVTGEHRGSLKVTVLENVGDASSWLSHGISQGTESHLGTQTLDLDGDGDLDVVSIAWDNFQNLQLWRNDAR